MPKYHLLHITYHLSPITYRLSPITYHLHSYISKSMSFEDVEGHIRFLQEGDSSVLSAEGKEEASFIETHPGFSNMADNDGDIDQPQPVIVDGQDEPNVDGPNQQSRRSSEANSGSEKGGDGGGAGGGHHFEDEEDEMDEAAREAAILKAEHERLSNILEAKSLISLERKPQARKRNFISIIWQKWFFIPKLIDPNLESELRKLDGTAHEMLVDAKRPEVFMYCCKLCYDNPSTSLHNCFKKNSSNSGPGNLPAHLRTSHKEEYDEYTKKESKGKKHFASDKSDSATPAKKQKTESSQVSTAASGAMTKTPSASKSRKSIPTGPNLSEMATEVSVASSITDSFSYYYSPNLQCHSSHCQVGTKQLVEEFKSLCHDFITFNNIPVRAGTSHRDCPEFKKLLTFAMIHGPQIRRQDNLIMGTTQFNNFRNNKFSTLLGAISTIAGEDRQWYNDYLKKEVPFITVGQDVWDSKQKETLGVTAFWYSPTRKKYLMLPLGLEEVVNKKADPSAKQTLKILGLCGIRKCDIYRAANDTTNTALMIGRLLTADGKQGTCAMHEIQLAIVHSTGMVERKKGKNITDSFPECESLRKKAMLASGYLMEKRAKSRLKKMQELMTTCGRVCCRIAMPASTRAAGILILFESLIRERFNLAIYWHSNVVAKDLTDSDYYAISQVASVLFPIGVLVKNVQSDKPGAISYTYFFILRTWVEYITRKKWFVAETRRKEHPDDCTRWDGSYTFPPRSYKGIPIENITEQKKLKKKKYIQLVPVARDKLLPIAQTLLERLIKEMTNYGVKPTDDRLLAIACNPLMATLGMEEFDLLNTFINTNEEFKELVVEMRVDYRQKSMNLLAEEIKSVCSEIIPVEGRDGDEGGDRDTGAEREEEIDEMEQLRMRLFRENERDVTENTNGDVDPVQSQVNAFFKQQFDPRSAMPVDIQGSVGATKLDWVKHWDLMVEHFDVFKWWETIGKKSFPLIYPIAIRILSLPDSNGSQERTFSSATWMDGKLNTRQNEITFRMKVLLYKNQAFLEEFKKEVNEKEKRAAADRTKALLKSMTSDMDDSDIDDELEGWMDACGMDEE
jgi:hAT family C-terminal dimerisation region